MQESLWNNFPPHPAIPVHAERVFSGVRSEVYQWDQVLYDGSIARFERIRYLDGAFVIPVLPNGRILLTRQEQPGREEFISLPWGALDPQDRSPQAWAQRELQEETGYISSDWYEWSVFLGTPYTATYVYYFIAKNCKFSSLQTPDAGEKITVFDVDFDEFLKLSSDVRFQHQSFLTNILYEARVSSTAYRELYSLLYTSN